jgi:DNA-binding NarL/FixJ family response regulator
MVWARESEVPRSHGAHQELSDREVRILILLAAGVTRQRIAQQLFVSTASVAAAIHCLYVKFHVSNSTSLVAMAYATGMLKEGVWPPALNSETGPD